MRPPDRDCVIETGAALVCVGDTAEVWPDVSIRIRDDRIVAIHRGRIAGHCPRVDARDQLVLPGLISAHTHVSVGSCTRAVIDGGGQAWAAHRIVELLDQQGLEDLIAVNLLELIRSGVTTVVNQEHNLRRAHAYVRVAARWGARGYPSGMVPGIQRLEPIWQRTDDAVLFASVDGTLAEIEANLAFGRRFNGAEEGRILPNLAPHAADTHTAQTLTAVRRAAHELGNGIHLHLSQSARETERVRAMWGKTPTAWLDELGLFDRGAVVAHLTGAELAADLKILAQRNVFYATCPTAGGVGGVAQPWPEALAAGVRSGPAIDTHGNDMIECLKLAVVHGQCRYELLRETSPVAMTRPTIEQAVDGATRQIADVLGRPDLGRLAVGAKADLVGIDVTGLWAGAGALSPRPLWNLLYASGSAVRTVMTDGRFQVYQNAFAVDDEARIIARGGAVSAHLYRELTREGFYS